MSQPVTSISRQMGSIIRVLDHPRRRKRRRDGQCVRADVEIMPQEPITGTRRSLGLADSCCIAVVSHKALLDYINNYCTSTLCIAVSGY